MSLKSKLKSLNPARGISNTWKREKQKAAVVLHGFKPLVGQAVKVEMKRNWYRHIDKAMERKTNAGDAKHWKKMARRFKKEIVGEPTKETTELLVWLKTMEYKIKNSSLTPRDFKRLEHFRSYMEDCEKNSMDNFIIKNKLMEVPK